MDRGPDDQGAGDHRLPDPAPEPGGSIVTRVVMAPAAALMLSTFLVLAIVGFDGLAGVATDDPLDLVVPFASAGVLVGGVVAGLLLRRTRRRGHRRIGLGTGSDTGDALVRGHVR